MNEGRWRKKMNLRAKSVAVFLVVFFFFCGGTALAAKVFVGPGDFSDINAAITGANPYDKVVLTEATVYNGVTGNRKIVIDKPITLMGKLGTVIGGAAFPGQISRQPTLRLPSSTICRNGKICWLPG